MKIFVFTNLFAEDSYIGGAEIQAYLLARHLASKNHQVNYIIWDGRGNIKEKQVENFKVDYLGKSDKGLIKHAINFYKICKLKSPDLCFIRNFRYLFILSFVCKILKIPAVYNTTHIDNCQPYPKKIKFSINLKHTLGSAMNAWYHYLSLRALKSVNVITINQTQAKILGQKYKIPATPIYNSMDDSYPQNKPAIKENIVIWAANLKARKQPELFINLANDLKNTNYKFLMIGYLQNNTKFYQDLINQTQASNPNFKYLGGMPAEEVNKLLAKSKIFVNTCLPEGFGNNFIQAWFNECPTITLDFDPDDIIKNHKIGYHSGSYEQLVKDTRFLIENPSTTEEMSQRARLYALENHLPQKNMVKYEKFFEALIKK